MIEVEKRVLLTKNQLAELKTYFDKNGRLSKTFKRFTMVLIEREDFVPEADSLIDLKIRTSGEIGKLALKYGNWHSAAGREEYEVGFKTKEIKDLMNIIHLLGPKYFVINYITRYEYAYNEFTITLDEFYHREECLMEVELMAETELDSKIAEGKINKLIKSFQLQSLDKDGMMQFVSGLNNILDLRVDFTKTTVEEWYDKWRDYIFCKK